MNSDLDTALHRMAAHADHPGLDGIEDTVLARIHAHVAPRAGVGPRLAAIAAIGAVALGTFSSRPTPATASTPSLSPFGASSPLAPSTLLLASQ